MLYFVVVVVVVGQQAAQPGWGESMFFGRLSVVVKFPGLPTQ